MSAKQPTFDVLPSSWIDFLTEVDTLLPRPVEIHCFGRFVLTALYGALRQTGDLDYLEAVPKEDAQVIQAIAGRGSKLHKKYHLYVDHVTVLQAYPDQYETRLTEIFPGQFSKLRLLALDVHDIILTKLMRNAPVDDEDVRFLVKQGVLDPRVLEERYRRELRPYLSNEEHHDNTLRLWL